jgi:hypothetical protein
VTCFVDADGYEITVASLPCWPVSESFVFWPKKEFCSADGDFGEFDCAAIFLTEVSTPS